MIAKSTTSTTNIHKLSNLPFDELLGVDSHGRRGVEQSGTVAVQRQFQGTADFKQLQYDAMYCIPEQLKKLMVLKLNVLMIYP